MPTKKGSWRDKGKGKCFTRVNKAGAKYVVCNDPPRGSKGQAGVYQPKGRGKKGQTDKELLDDFGGYSVKELNEKLDSMKGTSSKGGGSKASKIRKIYDKGGRLKKKPKK